MTKKLLFLPLLAMLWSFWPREGKDSIRCFRGSFRYPVVDKQLGVDTAMSIERRLYLDGGLLMYAYPYRFANGVAGVMTSSGSGYEYFVFNKDSLTGIQYDDQQPGYRRRFQVDSIKSCGLPALAPAMSDSGFGRLVSSTGNSRPGSLEEIYSDINIGIGHPNTDTCYVSYSARFNFLPLAMSLNRALDSLHKMRVCQVRLVVAGGHNVSWKLEELTRFDRDTVAAYFARYGMDSRVGRTF